MHDVGTIEALDAVLLKRGPLDHDEWAVMRRHPEMGANLLNNSNSDLLDCARTIAHTHRERWDGSGYPQGLKGKAIFLAGRLIMLADQYDALRSKRFYKPALSQEKTCDILLNGNDRTRPEHFDPQLLLAFQDLHHAFEVIYARIVDE